MWLFIKRMSTHFRKKEIKEKTTLTSHEQICILSCLCLVSLCLVLLLIITRKSVLETSLNDFYTYLDLHLSIQLTMCLMHPICYVSLSTA
jgi:hypothetical protein